LHLNSNDFFWLFESSILYVILLPDGSGGLTHFVDLSEWHCLSTTSGTLTLLVKFWSLVFPQLWTSWWPHPLS